MNNARVIIGFDLDDILFDFVAPMAKWHNATYGTSHTSNDFFSYEFHTVWNCEGEEAVDRVWQFYHSDFCKRALPIAGAVEALRQLAQNHRLIIVTARPDSMEASTRAWLDTYFPGVFDTVVFTNHYHGSSERRTKSSVCTELGVRLFVEDALHNAEDIAGAGIPVLLFDRPWNRTQTLELVTRVFSWDEIVEKIIKKK